MELDATRPGQSVERANCRGQLHAIVGRRGLPAGNFPFGLAVAEQRGPAAGARIAAAAPSVKISTQGKLGHRRPLRRWRVRRKLEHHAFGLVIGDLAGHLEARGERLDYFADEDLRAEAPAVTPIVAGVPSQSQSISVADFITRAGVPERLATSARRSELLLLGAPMTKDSSAVRARSP